jgi:hypothetical protein
MIGASRPGLRPPAREAHEATTRLARSNREGTIRLLLRRNMDTTMGIMGVTRIRGGGTGTMIGIGMMIGRSMKGVKGVGRGKRED